LLYDLLHTELGDWHPREIYETEALREQKIHSLKPEEEWFEAVLQEGMIPGMERDYRITTEDALKDARGRIPRLRSMSEISFGRFLQKQGCWARRTNMKRGWQFPSLSKARKTWEGKFGSWVWDEPRDEWEMEMDFDG
jgi:hypothetical protein